MSARDRFNRTREYNYTVKERAEMLRDIRDNALEWLYQQVASKKSSGTSAATNSDQTVAV